MKTPKHMRNGNRLPYRCELHGVWYDYTEKCGECVEDLKDKSIISKAEDK